MALSILDIIFIIIFAASLIICTARGFIDSCVGKAAFIISIFLAISFTPTAEILVKKWFDIEILTTIVAFLLAFVIAFVLLKILQLIIKKCASNKILNSLDHALGFFWGAAFGLLLVCTILLFLQILPIQAVDSVLQKSFFAKFFLPIISDFQVIDG